MITKGAAGIWEISIPAPLPCSASEQLIGYVRYTPGHLEVRASHLIGRTDQGMTIMPLSEDPAVRDALARALLWRLLSDVLVPMEPATLMPESSYSPPTAHRSRAVPLDTGSFGGGDGLSEEAPDYDAFLGESR